MRDDLGHRIDSQLGAEEPREPDLTWVVARGRRLRTLRRAAAGVGTAAVIAAGSIAVVALPTDRPLPAPVVGDQTPAPVDDGATGPGMVEEMTEQDQAEVFAFRAMAYTGLMYPFSARSFNWTYADDTTQTDEGWRIGFAASDCEPRDNTFTCRGLSGEDPELGNALTDTFATVRLNGDRWIVVDVEGNILPEERERVVGYTLPQRAEPSHWQFPAVGVWPINDEYSIELVALWVGPYPTSAPGSVCKLRTISDSGEMHAVVDSVFYQEPPNRPFERGGWIRGIGGGKYADAERAEVVCRQYTGRGWEIVSEPELVGEPGAVRGVTAQLEWHGDEGFTAPAVCDATLLDENGNEVWKGSGRVEPLWRESELKEYPYKASAFVQDRGNLIPDAVEVGEFNCRTR